MNESRGILLTIGEIFGYMTIVFGLSMVILLLYALFTEQ